MRQGTWRAIASPIIAAAIKEADENGMNNKEMKRLISSRYPFHERKYHPYKIWCNEVKAQLELYLSGNSAAPLSGFAVRFEPSCIDQKTTLKPLAGQKELFPT